MFNPFKEKDELVEQGYLVKSEFENLVLYNYSKKCEYERYWIPATLSSRGTIYDKTTGIIVARAFDKFFNYNQTIGTLIENLPKSKPSISIKVDGSLGIGFQDQNGMWRVSTRGSFYSDQAVQATIMIESAKMTTWPSDWTPLFEIIYPENRIITDYGDESALYLIAARSKETGAYASSVDLNTLARVCGFKRAKAVEMTLEEIMAALSELPGNDEGFVAQWPNLLVKFKGKRYMEIAKFKASLNPLSIWDAIRDHTIQSLMEDCPDEFIDEARRLFLYLTAQFDAINRHVNDLALSLNIIGVSPNDADEMKRIASVIKTQRKWVQPILYGVVRGYTIDAYIWRMLRPDGGQFADLSSVLE